MYTLKLILFLVFCSTYFGVYAQEQEEDITLDMISAPQSPAANLLGFAESEINKPETPTDVMVSFRNATNNFSTVPSSFALDLNVGTLLGKQVKIDSAFFKTKPWNLASSLRQNTVLSIGYKNFDELKDTIYVGQGLGLGLKITFCQGKIEESSTERMYSAIKNKHRDINDGLSKALKELKASPEYKALKTNYTKKTKEIEEKISAVEDSIHIEHDSLRTSSLFASLKKLYTEKCALEQQYMTKRREKEESVVSLFNLNSKTIYDEIRDTLKALKNTEFRHYGFVCDLTIGTVLNFPDNEIRTGNFQKASAWLTFGQEWKKGTSLLGVVRYSYNENLIYRDQFDVIKSGDISNLDIGGRLIYDRPNGRFSVSVEGLLRHDFMSNTEINTRYTINLGYKLMKNTNLSFVLGKDFEGNYSLDNNIISSLNLTFGFGSKRHFDFSTNQD